MAQSIAYMLAAAGPFLFGSIHDLTHSWTVSLAMLAAVTVIFGMIGFGAGANRLLPEQSQA